MHRRVLSLIAALSLIQPLLAGEPSEERAVLDAIPTPPMFQNPFMGASNFREIHLNAYQTDTTSARGPASARSQTVQQGLLRPITAIAGTMAFTSRGQILTSRVGLSPTPVAGTDDRCARSAALQTGPQDGAYYSTVAPFEHFDSNRTQTFASTCTIEELAGLDVRVDLRRSAVNFATPYIAATRDRDQLYVYGYGSDPATDGGYVALVDPTTLEQQWRTEILDTSPAGQWSYPGVVVAHGNGFLYAIYANVLVKLDPVSGAILASRVMPETSGDLAQVYNGIIVLPDGRLAAKNMVRGPCGSSTVAGLECVQQLGAPSYLTVVDPEQLEIVDSLSLGDTVIGRITWGQVEGVNYIYVAGSSTVTRYSFIDDQLALDTSWGPVTYRTGKEQPGTGAGILGDWVIVQTNFTPGPAPLKVTAASQRDSRQVFHIKPFADLQTRVSWIVSKAALDVENSMVVTHDTAVGHMAGLTFDPDRGFDMRWRKQVRSFDFSALIGDADHRQLVIPNFIERGEQVVWLDVHTGRQVAQAPERRVLARVPSSGNIVTPGFDGTFYYLSTGGTLWELRPMARR